MTGCILFFARTAIFISCELRDSERCSLAKRYYGQRNGKIAQAVEYSKLARYTASARGGERTRDDQRRRVI